jgi:hypothetical protein
MASVWAELKRRKVAPVYADIAWLITQIIDTVSEPPTAPVPPNSITQ